MMKEDGYERLRSINGLVASDAPSLLRFSERLIIALPEILDEYYGGLQAESWAHEYLKTEEQWQRHRDGVRNWVVTVVTQNDAEIEDLARRTGETHVNLEIHCSWFVASAAHLMALVANKLSSAPDWSASARDALARRWSYSVSIMVKAYEDKYMDQVVQRKQEIASLNKILHQMLIELPEETPQHQEAWAVAHRLDELLE